MKIETKLHKLGYSKPTDLSFINQHQIKDNEYVKVIEGLYAIRIIVKNNAIVNYSLDFGACIGTPTDKIDFTKACIILGKDLEILKGVENEN